MLTLICPKCKSQLKADDLFCSKCGTKLEPVKPVCMACWKTLNEDDSFCARCGTPVGDKSVTHQVSTVDLESLYEKGLDNYENGRYVSALPSLKEAAEKGHPKAQFYLGYFYVIGAGVEKNENEASKLRKLAEEKGITGYGFPFGLHPAIIKENRDILLKTAEKGDARAQYHLALHFYHELSDSLEKDMQKVMMDSFEKWLIKSAENEFAPAQYFYATYHGLITHYTKNIMVRKVIDERFDRTRRIDLLHASSEQGNADAQLSLAVIYEKGEFVKKNAPMAFSLYSMAAKEGHESAAYYVGRCYETGFGVSKDKIKAIEWYQKSGDYGKMYLKSH